MATTNLTDSLSSALKLLRGAHNPLAKSNAYFTYKGSQGRLLGQNIVSKAAQLVSDLENARAAERSFQTYLAQKQQELKSTASQRGFIFEDKA